MIRLVTYNIRRGGAGREARLIQAMQLLDPDLVLLQEATLPSVVGVLASALGLEVLGAEPGRSVAVMGKAGVATAITWRPIRAGRWVAELDIAGGRATVIATHLSAGLSGRGERRRAWEARALLDLAAEGAGATRTIIAGDLNAIAPRELVDVARLPRWIRALLRVDGGIGTSVIGRLLAEGFVDAFRWCRGDADGTTMPAIAPSVRLDYFLVGRAVVPWIADCRVVPSTAPSIISASDHLPVVLDLVPTVAAT